MNLESTARSPYHSQCRVEAPGGKIKEDVQAPAADDLILQMNEADLCL